MDRLNKEHAAILEAHKKSLRKIKFRMISMVVYFASLLVMSLVRILRHDKSFDWPFLTATVLFIFTILLTPTILEIRDIFVKHYHIGKNKK
jgi:hypothetical protein